ncbi:hypothetical protein BYT27DRAFT_7224832 [Phlegmacium glaucopus]|nr:hypothetical protein BYT27DRAFT_7224832 [Phlegmacium glaucopus]
MGVRGAWGYALLWVHASCACPEDIERIGPPDEPRCRQRKIKRQQLGEGKNNGKEERTIKKICTVSKCERREEKAYAMRDHDNNTTTQPPQLDPDLMNPSASSSTAHDTPATTSTSENLEKTSGQWTKNEIGLPLDYIEGNCILTTGRGLNLKKLEFNKARTMMKLKDANQCHYKWGHLCTIYKVILQWDKKSGSGWHDDYGANARTPSEKRCFKRMHAFDPASSSSQSATQILNLVNTEEDGAEDQVDPSLDSPMATVSSLIPPDLGTFLTSSIILSLLPPDSSMSSSSSHTKPPPSSSLPPTVYPQPTQQCDVSMSLAHSITTGSNADSSQFPKCKHDARSASGMQPSSKWALKKTDDLNPVIILNALNSTLNRMVDVMERTLDATTVTTAAPSTMTSTTSIAPPSIVNSSIESSQPLSASMSPAEILDQAIRIISGVDSRLTEDQLLSASLFFTSASEDAVHAPRTFIALGNNQTVQYRFLLSQLSMSALSGKDKAKAVEDGDDHFMVTSLIF